MKSNTLFYLKAPYMEYRPSRFDVENADPFNLTQYGFDFAVEVYGKDYQQLTEEYGKIVVR